MIQKTLQRTKTRHWRIHEDGLSRRKDSLRAVGKYLCVDTATLRKMIEETRETAGKEKIFRMSKDYFGFWRMREICGQTCAQTHCECYLLTLRL